MSFRFVIGKVLAALATLVFVVCFNFFLFRVVESRPGREPVSAGKNLTRRAATRAPSRVRPRRLEGRAVRPLPPVRPRSSTSGARTRRNRPVREDIWERAWPTIALVGVSTLFSAIFGVLIGIVAAWRRRSKADYGWTGFTMATYAMPDFWLGMLLLVTFAVTLGWFPVGGITDSGSDATGVAKLVDQAHHMFLPALTLTLAYLGRVRARDALVAPRHDAGGLPHAGAGKGPPRRGRPQPPRGAERVASRRHADRDQLRVRALGCDRGRDDLLVAGPRAPRRTRRFVARTCRCCRGCSSCFSAAVIFFNLVADLLYGYLDPRVRTQ